MAENSGISWTDHTFNPWIGCTKVSDGCKFCYAKDLAEVRLGREWGPSAARVMTSNANWNLPLRWDRRAQRDGRRFRVFCASLADVFDDHPSILPEWRARLWRLIAATPNLDWLLLTKRPEHWLLYLPVDEPVAAFGNIRLGVTIENQAACDERAMDLVLASSLGWPTFVSYEPALGPVEWGALLDTGAVDWLIAGGESGQNGRPARPDWFRHARDLCQARGVPFHFKQWGQWAPRADVAGLADVRIFDEPDLHSVGKRAGGRTLDGRVWDQFP
jgi:protein gp37